MPKPTLSRPTGGVAMAEKLDATSRLAEGRPSVDIIQNYVSACHQLGYQNPDLTLHAAQVRDWYASEDGLDLRALNADCAALERVVAATEDALDTAGRQLGAMSGAWSGHGAEASREFLRRHGEASAVAAAAVRTAADALAALRDSSVAHGRREGRHGARHRGPSAARSVPSGWPPRRP